MILRILPLLLLMIVLPDWWLITKMKKRGASRTKMLLWLLPSLLMIILTIVLACQKDFASSGDSLLETYLILLGLLVAPKVIYCICSLIGSGICTLLKKKNNYGNLVGILFVPVLWFVTLWGFTKGFSKVEVKHYVFESPDLPAAFRRVPHSAVERRPRGNIHRKENGNPKESS